MHPGARRTRLLVVGVVAALAASLAMASPAAAASPVNTRPSAKTLTFGVDLAVKGFSVSDADGTPLEVQLTSNGSGALPQFTFGSTTGLTVSAGSPTRSNAVTLAGSQVDLNEAFKTLVVHPSTSLAAATYTMTMTTDDVVGDTVGNIDSDVFTLNQMADIAPVNTMPAASKQIFTGLRSPLPGITVSDVDGSPLEVSLEVAGIAPRPNFSLGSTAGITVSAGLVSNSQSATISGTQEALNAALATLTVRGATAAGTRNLVVVTRDVVGAEGGLSDTDNILLNTIDNVAPVNSVPVSPKTVRFGQPLSVTGFRVYDPTSSELEVRLRLEGALAPNPTFSITPSAGVTVTAGSATDSVDVTVGGSQAAINLTLATVVINPAMSTASGSWTMVMETDDQVGTSPGELSDTDSIVVNQSADVAPVNMKPPTPQTVGTNTPSPFPGFGANDADGSKLEIKLTVLGADPKPTFSFGSTAGLTVSSGSVTESTAVLVSGTQAALNAAFATLIVTGSPAPGAFHMVIDTDDTPGNAGGLTDTDIIALNVVPVPSAPLDVSAIGGNASALVTWDPPVTSGDSAVIGYEVRVSPGGTTFDAGNALRVTIPGLSNSTDYLFQVRARNANGFGPWSTQSNAARPRAACTVAAFTDVPTLHALCPEITWLVSNGIASGFADGSFHPTEILSRQAVAVFAYRMAGSPNGAKPTCSSAPFSDVPTSHPFCGEITWAKNQSVISGFSDGTFKPSSSLSRQAIAAVLYRMAGSPRGSKPICTTNAFTDVPAGHTFCGEIDWVSDNGIDVGFADGSFGPGGTVSRQTMAAFLYRFDLAVD